MKRSHTLALVAIPTVMVVGGLLALNAWSSGPAEGTIRTGTPSAATPSTEQAAPLLLSTGMFTASLPVGFVQKDASPPTTDIPIRLLATKTASRQQVGISGGPLPVEGLSGVADYNLRAKDTTGYKRSTLSSLPAGATAFEDTTGSMITLFWPHDRQYVSVTASGSPGSQGELSDLLLKILQKWQWN